jgi:hypothetical protein
LAGATIPKFIRHRVTRHPAFAKRGEYLRRIGTFLHERRLRIVAVLNNRQAPSQFLEEMNSPSNFLLGEHVDLQVQA